MIQLTAVIFREMNCSEWKDKTYSSRNYDMNATLLYAMNHDQPVHNLMRTS